MKNAITMGWVLAICMAVTPAAQAAKKSKRPYRWASESLERSSVFVTNVAPETRLGGPLLEHGRPIQAALADREPGTRSITREQLKLPLDGNTSGLRVEVGYQGKFKDIEGTKFAPRVFIEVKNVTGHIDLDSDGFPGYTAKIRERGAETFVLPWSKKARKSAPANDAHFRVGDYSVHVYQVGGRVVVRSSQGANPLGEVAMSFGKRDKGKSKKRKK